MATLYKVMSDGFLIYPSLDFDKVINYISRVQDAGDNLDKYANLTIKAEEIDNEEAEDICWYVWVDVNAKEITNVCPARYDDHLDVDGMRSETEDCYRIVTRTYKEMTIKLAQHLENK